MKANVISCIKLDVGVLTKKKISTRNKISRIKRSVLIR